MESTPEYNFVTDDELFVLRWKVPTVAALERLSETLSARSKAVGRPLFYVALVPASAPPPDEATRSALLDGIVATNEYVGSIRLVIIGRGFQATLIRSGVTAMTLASGLRGYPFRVARSVNAALADYTKQAKREHEPLVERLVRVGIVTREELS